MTDTVYTLRHTTGDKGTVYITREALALAGQPAERSAVPAFSSMSRAITFYEDMARWLGGPVEVRTWDRGELAECARICGHDVAVDPVLEGLG